MLRSTLHFLRRQWSRGCVVARDWRRSAGTLFSASQWRDSRRQAKPRKVFSPDSSEWVKTYTDMLGRSYLTKFPDGASSRQYFNSLGQLWKSVDPDGVTRLYQYNDLGEQEYTALDMDRNDAIDFTGTDQITRSVRSVGEATASGLSGGDAHIAETYVWTTDSANTSLLISRVESLVDGTGSAQTSFGLTGYSFHSCGGACAATNRAPDGTHIVTIKTNGYPVQVTRYDSNNAPMQAVYYGYDAHSRQNAVTNVLGSTSVSTSPSASSPTVQITLTSHDLLGRPVTVIRGVGTALAQTNTHHYDSVGGLWKQVEPDSSSVTNEFYLTSATKKTYGSRTYPVEYTYDYAGRMKTMKTWQNFAGNSGTATTTWNYHSQRGFLSSKRYHDNQGPDYTYTSAGRLATRTWARGIVTTYGYNEAGAMTNVVYSDLVTPSVATSYDRRGRAKTVSSVLVDEYNEPVQTIDAITLAYNDAGQTVGETHIAGLLSGLTVTNTYDALLRRSSLGLSPLSLSTLYTYDAASRLLSVSDGTNNAAYSYLANSHLVSNIVFKQSSTTRMTTTKQYDNLGRLTSIGSVPSASSAISFNYQYNLANQRTAITNADGSYWVYAYDVLGQVTSGKRYWSDATPVEGQQFEYGFDDIGNRKTTKVGGDQNGANLRTATYGANLLNQYTNRTVPSFVEVQGSAHSNATVMVNNFSTYRKGEYFRKELTAYNLDNPLWLGITNVAVRQNPPNPDIVTTNQGNVFVAKTPEAFTHDADGNLLDNAEWNLTWDGENRLVSAETTFNAAAAGKPRQKLEFAYDHQSRRIQKKLYAWDDGLEDWVLSSDHRFIYDGWNLISVLSSALSPQTSFLWGTDLSSSMQGAGGVGGLLAVSNHQSPIGTHFAAYDGNGNVSALVSAADGTESARYEYGPFHELLRATGPLAFLNPFRASTKYQDDETDWLYYGYRYYDPSTGRWLSRDPIEELGGLNEFGLVLNRPIAMVDLLGLMKLGDGCCMREAVIDYFSIVDDGSKVIQPQPKIPFAAARWKANYKVTGDYEDLELVWWTCSWQGAANMNLPPNTTNYPYVWKPSLPGSNGQSFPILDQIAFTLVIRGKLRFKTCVLGIWSKKRAYAYFNIGTNNGSLFIQIPPIAAGLNFEGLDNDPNDE